MPVWLVYALVTLAFALASTWTTRRLLDLPFGWVRALVVAVIVFVVGTPAVLWVLRESRVLDGDRFVVDGPIAAAFFALTMGWLFAAVVVVDLTIEFLWPSRRIGNPVTLVREAFRRRDRARRYAQIVAIASRHGVGLYQSHRHGSAGDDLPASLVAALNEAGVTFVKLGQVLSSREDVLPRDLVDALATLQMDSTPIPWSQAREAIEAELGRPLDEVFAVVDEEPLAAASVAQVHAATLVSGERVVVKIQRPRARAQVVTDLDILERLAADAERRTDWAREYGARSLVAEFSRSLREELDYRIEASNTEMLRGAVAKSESARIRVPAVFAEYSTSRMLVQERVEGTPFSRVSAGALPPERAHDVADSVVDAVFEQIAVRGVFHADLHAGNLILDEEDPDVREQTVTLIDFGSIGILERSIRRLLLPLLVAIAGEDDLTATDVVLLLCAPTSGTTADRAALQHDIGVILTRVANSKVDENVFRALVEVIRTHRLAMPPSLLLVFRTLTSLEGTLRRLVPGYDMVGRALSRAPHFARELTSPREALLSLQSQAALAIEELRRVPRSLRQITRSLEDGTFTVRLRAFESTPERGWVEGLFAQFVTTLVGIAFVVTGILLAVFSADGPMLTADVPAYSFLGSVVGLGGLLLLLRGLGVMVRRRDDGPRDGR